MDLSDVIQRVANEYAGAAKQPLADHPFAAFMRREVPRLIQALLNEPELVVKASVGQGGWAESPWIAILDKTATDGPQEGVYVVYLFSSDLTSLHLSLAQGVTRPIKRYGRQNALRRLKTNAENIRTNFALAGFDDYDDAILGTGNRASAYEDSIIYSKKYLLGSLPENEILENDLRVLVDFYRAYLAQRDLLTIDTDFSDAIGKVEEGKLLLRLHYTRERNPRIIQKVKKLALAKFGELRCEVCGFCFKDAYDGRTDQYIEGHHKRPVSEMNEGETTSPEDIALICSNCHRAIHAKWPYISVEELKTIFQAQKRVTQQKLSTWMP